MRTLSGIIIAVGLCLVLLVGDASARGFGGFRGGFGGGYGRFDGGDGFRSFRAGEYYGARRAAYAGAGAAAGYYSGGWGMDECDDSNGDCNYDDGD